MQILTFLRKMKTKLGEAGIAEYAMPLNIDTESAGSSLALNEFPVIVL